jgi:serine/threonine-protein kinase RsbW
MTEAVNAFRYLHRGTVSKPRKTATSEREIQTWATFALKAVVPFQPFTSPRGARVTNASGVAGLPAARPRDVVVITLPADSAYLSVLRTATAGLAARLDFTIDEIEDLRIAVDEACAMLLPQASVDADIVCEFELAHHTIGVDVSVLTVDGQQPSRDTFAWTVLSALAGDVDSSADAEGRVTISLRKHGSGSSR